MSLSRFFSPLFRNLCLIYFGWSRLPNEKIRGLVLSRRCTMITRPMQAMIFACDAPLTPLTQDHSVKSWKLRFSESIAYSFLYCGGALGALIFIRTLSSCIVTDRHDKRNDHCDLTYCKSSGFVSTFTMELHQQPPIENECPQIILFLPCHSQGAS